MSSVGSGGGGGLGFVVTAILVARWCRRPASFRRRRKNKETNGWDNDEDFMVMAIYTSLGRYLLPSIASPIVCVEVLHVLVIWHAVLLRWAFVSAQEPQVERCGLFILGLCRAVSGINTGVSGRHED
jgi:hypothetical protein